MVALAMDVNLFKNAGAASVRIKSAACRASSAAVANIPFRFAAVLALCLANPAWAQQSCTPDHVDLPKEQATGSAGLLANVSKSRGSLRTELSRLLDNANKHVAQAKPPGNACSPACRAGTPAHISFKVTPNKFLESYGDFDKCEKLQKQTSSQPFKFGPHRAETMDELAGWLSEVSQGDGPDGAVLYEKCGGKCSPRYSMDVSSHAGKFVATLEVICGHARDKKDNRYNIASGYRWACEVRR
jgi:hypothetical protein